MKIPWLSFLFAIPMVADINGKLYSPLEVIWVDFWNGMQNFYVILTDRIFDYWVAVVTQIVHPKSARNRCALEDLGFWWRFCMCVCIFWH